MVKPDVHITFTPDAFNSLFDYYLVIAGSPSEAYELTEKEHEESCGMRKYSGYDSFRKVRKRMIKKRMSQKRNIVP